MKHLMPGMVKVQRAPGAGLQDSLISLQAPAGTAPLESSHPAAPPTTPKPAPASPGSLTAAFAARLHSHQHQQPSPSAEASASALRDINVQQAAASPPQTPGCIPLAMISPLRSCARTGVARTAGLKTPAASATLGTGLGFPSVKTPHASASQKKLVFEATPCYGLQGPRVLQRLDGDSSSSCVKAATPESVLQRKLVRQSEGGLLPISLNVLQV